MGLLSRSKGKCGEREVVAMARARGLSAERTWQLAQSPDHSERCCDMRISGRAYQVRGRAGDGFERLYARLDGLEGLFVLTDSQERLAVVRAEDYLGLLAEHPMRCRKTKQRSDST